MALVIAFVLWAVRVAVDARAGFGCALSLGACAALVVAPLWR